MRHTRGYTPLAAGTAVLALTVSGCGSSSLDTASSPSAPTVSASQDSGLAAQVPAKYRGKTLSIGADASYAPNEFFAADNATVQGMDVDLATAVAQKLGLKVKVSNAAFTSIIPGVTSGKYDAGISSFTITAERLKTVTMVSYFSAGTQWATLKGNPKKIDPASPCGTTIGVQDGTTQVDELNALNTTTCAAKPMKLVVEDLQSKVTTDLVSGKVDAMAADSPVTLYAVKQTADKLQAVGKITGAAPYGVVLPKDQDALAQLLVKAFEAMRTDGTYAKILQKWGQSSGAVETFAVNPTPSS